MPESFEALAKSLRAQGLRAPAERLEGVLNGVWTTSTELLGELGLVVLRIRKEHGRALTPESKGHLKACLKDVRVAWPGIGLSWIVWGSVGLVCGGLALWYAWLFR